MTRRKILIGISAIAFLLLAYLLFWPVPIDPAAWTPPEAPELAGVYQPNDLLTSVERLGQGAGLGPEDVAVDDQGRIDGGMEDGSIMRFQADGSHPEVFADTKGRPLGLHFDAAGNLIVGDARQGLLSVSPQGQITALSTQAEGLPFMLTDDVDVAQDGTIYFTDASSKFGDSDYMLDLMEHRPHGRLLAYDPADGSSRVLLDHLYFANGVAVSPDQSFLLVVETGMYRVLRYWIAGPREGQWEVFKDNLPGFPDGISSDGEDTFWVALVSPRHPGIDFAFQHPFSRKILVRLPSQVLEPPSYGFVLGLDTNGQVVYNLQDPSGSYAYITSVQEHEGMLYLGSLKEDAIGRLPVPQEKVNQ